MTGKTLYDKLWQSHVVREEADGTCLLYIDRHLVHEVTSPQAFEGLRLAGRKAWRSSSIVANPDHNTPTDHWDQGIKDPVSRLQVETLDANIKDFGALAYFPFKHADQGIIHVIGPENGATLPGMTVVCGDSHTSTHGAFGALAHGIGTSEVEHVLATQTLVAKKSKRMLIKVEGKVGAGVTAKDIALAIIGKIGTAGGTGYAVEFGGSAIRDLSMEGRMTLCNLAIEGGARAGLVAPDETTFAYVMGRPAAPKGAAWEMALASWKTFFSDPDARFDREETIDVSTLAPTVTWGTSPEDVVEVTGRVPDPAGLPEHRAAQVQRMLDYMGLTAGQPMLGGCPRKFSSHQRQSSGTREKGASCFSSRAAHTGQCGLDSAGRPSITTSISSSRTTRSAVAGMPRFQLVITGRFTACRTRWARSIMNSGRRIGGSTMASVLKPRDRSAMSSPWSFIIAMATIESSNCVPSGCRSSQPSRMVSG